MTAIDLTDEELAVTAALTTAEFHEILEQLHVGVCVVDVSETVLYCNSACAEMLDEADKDAVIGRNILEYLAEGQMNVIEEEAARRRKGECSRYEVEIISAQGVSKRVVLSINPRFDQRGEFVGSVGAWYDVTHLRSVEHQQELMATAVQSAAESIVVTDSEGKVKYANPFFFSTTGFTPDEVIGRNASIQKSGVHSPEFYCDLWGTLKAKKVWKGRFTNKKKDGSRYEEEATISPIVNRNGATVSYVAVKRDITDQLRLQARLAGAEKMETVALLAGGIAHDLNNFLMVIEGTASLMAREQEADGPWHLSLQEITRASGRAKSMVADLLTFARRSQGAVKMINLSDLVKSSCDLLSHMLGSRQELICKVTEQPCFANLDSAAIDRILMNLIVNARDALPESGGKIEIEVEVEAVPEESVDPTIRILVKDNGHGIPETLLQKIWLPFFTTKDMGRGTGLGLSVVHGLVTEAGGSISVESSEETGTTFTILLPSEPIS